MTKHLTQESIERIQNAESTPIQVHFKTGIRADGKLIAVRITQFEQQLQLTEPQAISLAKQLLNRFASDLLVE